MEERRKPRFSLRWVVGTILVLTICLGNFGFQVLRLWNLQKDLDLDFLPPPRAFSSLPFTAGLGYPKAMGYALPATLSDYLIRQEAIDPRFLPFSLASFPETEELWPRILERTSVGFASFPTMLLASQPYDFWKPEILIVELMDISQFWLSLAVSHVGRASPGEVATAVLGAALITVFMEAMVAPNLTLMCRMITCSCLGNAYETLVLCAPAIRPSVSEARFMIGNLQKIEDFFVSFATMVETESRFYRSLRDTVRKGLPRTGKDGYWRWPGWALSEVMDSEEIVRFVEKEFFGSIVRISSEPWIASHPVWVRLLDESNEARIALKGSKAELLMRFIFRPKAMFKAWLACSQSQVHHSLWKTDFLTRQHGRVAQWSVAVFGFRRERGKWPGSPQELEEWLGMSLPRDIFSYGPILFAPGDPPEIRSIGSDQVPFTIDDLRAIPSGAASVTSFLERGE